MSNGSKTRRWLAVALVVSVGINLLFVGIAAGRYFTHRGFERPGEPIAERIGRALPPEAGEIFRNELRQRRPDIASARLALREARQEVRTALAAEPFDPARLEAALGEMRRRGLSLQQTMHESMVASARQMSPEARRRLAEWDRPHR
jgi:uncharacterized membrane protein